MLDTWGVDATTHLYNIGICPTCGDQMALSGTYEYTLECDNDDCDTKVPLHRDNY